ncbi:16S rRNA (cytosine(1402)-N(4))-methyltransferase RsmH [Paenibacillus turpanensis]|uniref:16S rRNA (cytosine(1402)-N(4))-methyltransferase RsmH n=1 Tax=Paenibacillus turpanensis TaxID=2689078 RepID=UPI00140D216A|nr:16S rRNA (cytosine(1402)-N(4))-methyltransferase RsmH [Paenibacillus turpanensis]
MFHHITVLLNEAVDGLQVKPDGIYVDCTLGGAGHSSLIASKLGEKGTLIAFDQDDTALNHAKQKLAGFNCRIELVKSNFRHLREKLLELDAVPKKDGIPQVDGILFDLGVSSPQLDEGERGFSYNQDAPLDMRMDQTAPFTAYELINEWPEEKISRVLYEYGEEKFSRRIASRIVQERSEKPIKTTFELAEIVKNAIPAATRRSGPHPARRSFQAVRIAVNDELGAFEDALDQAVACLAPGGRVAVITFHSLEDRICKQKFAELLEKCTCPPGLPVCMCGTKGTLKLTPRKPIEPSAEELEHNSRARSAKLRIAEKITN